MYKIAFVGPAKGTKPFVVLSSLLETDALIDWPNSLIITEDFPQQTQFLKLVNDHNLTLIKVTDRSLATDSAQIKNHSPDFLISCGWGSKISQSALETPTIAALNCHSSYLPDYKGASVFQHYWANCEDWMGATIHTMTDNFDDGNIISQQKAKIFPGDTPDTLLYRLSELSAILLREAILRSASGYKGKPQTGGRYFKKIKGKKIRLYRWYNLIAKKTGLPKILTPHS